MARPSYPEQDQFNPRYFVILSTLIRLGHPIDLFPYGFKNKNLNKFLSPPFMLRSLSHPQ
jgi:hypothetical protein